MAKLLVCFAFSAALCWADADQIRRFYKSILNESPDRALPTYGEVTSALAGMNALGSGEVETLLPLAKQCLQSRNSEVRQDGIMLLLSVALRFDSAKLLEPYVDDLGSMLSEPASPLRKGALFILALTTSKPRVSPKSVATLASHLEDTTFSTEEISSVIGSLLDTSPSDPAVVHKVLSIVQKRSDIGLTNGVIRVLGLVKSQSAEALNFIGKGLDSASPDTRESAVEAVSRLDRDLRTRFAAQLGRIAADNTLPQHIRSQAVEAIR